MADSNFQVFAESATTVMSDTEYQTDSQRTGGVVPGLAAPKLHNKLYKQATIMAAAIAQVLVSQGYDAKDGDLAALVASAKHALTLSVGGVKPDASGNIPLSVNGNIPDAEGKITVPSGITMSQIYPVGSVYFSADKEFSPATAFGGTWSLLEQGRFIRAAGSTMAALTTGGADSVTLAVANLPPHSHSGSSDNAGNHTHSGTTSTSGNHAHSGTTDSAGEHSHFGVVGGVDSDGKNVAWMTPSNSYIYSNVATSSAGAHVHSFSIASSGSHNHSFTTNSGGSHSHTITIGDTGSGTAFNILPSWLSLYVWRRTA